MNMIGQTLVPPSRLMLLLIRGMVHSYVTVDESAGNQPEVRSVSLQVCVNVCGTTSGPVALTYSFKDANPDCDVDIKNLSSENEGLTKPVRRYWLQSVHLCPRLIGQCCMIQG